MLQNIRLTVWKKSKNRDWSNVVSTDELSLYIHNSGISM